MNSFSTLQVCCKFQCPFEAMNKDIFYLIVIIIIIIIIIIIKHKHNYKHSIRTIVNVLVVLKNVKLH